MELLKSKIHQLKGLDLSDVDIDENKIRTTSFNELTPEIMKILNKLENTDKQTKKILFRMIFVELNNIIGQQLEKKTLMKLGEYLNTLFSEESESPFQPPASSAPAPMDLNILKTDKFDVLGYVVDPSTGRVSGIVDSSRYVFHVEKGTVGERQEQFLLFSLHDSLLQSIKIEKSGVNEKESFKTNRLNTTFRVVLQKPVNIREFVDSVNNGSIIVELPHSLQPSQTKMASVRLFIRPMTYPETTDENKLAINKLGIIIDSEISKNVSQQPMASPRTLQLHAQSQSLDTSNPQTDKFDVLGFTINREHKLTSYVIPPEQTDKVLELLPSKLREQINRETPIKLIDENTKARITFKQRLSIKETLGQVNNFDSPIKVNFTTASGKPLNVYLFMVPMTYRINDSTGEGILPTFEVINELAEKEMDKIMKAMETKAKKRVEAPSSPAQAPSRGRGGIVRGITSSRGGSLSSRGPYRHPIKEYNL